MPVSSGPGRPEGTNRRLGQGDVVLFKEVTHRLANPHGRFGEKLILPRIGVNFVRGKQRLARGRIELRAARVSDSSIALNVTDKRAFWPSLNSDIATLGE